MTACTSIADPRSVDTQPMRRRILLTGVSGQVGAELWRSLQPLGNVVATDRRTATDGGPNCLALDLADPDQIRAVVRDVRPHLIVNAAAYTAVDKAESEPELATAINAKACGILAEEANRLNAPLIHYSTDYVFDGTGTTPWREDDRVGPLNEYGRGKLAGEQAIQAVGLPHLILRTSWVFAPQGANFVRTMLRLGSTRSSLTIVDDQVGAPTSARVLADITCQILAQGLPDWSAFFRDRGGIVHAACAGETNWHAFALDIFRLARLQGWQLVVNTVAPIPTSAYPTPAKRPKNSRLDCRRLAERFQLVPPPWQVALEQSFPPPEMPATAGCKVA